MDRIEIYLDELGEYRWRYVRAGNNKRLANGGEGYKHRGDLVEALKILFAPTEVDYQVDSMTDLLRWKHTDGDTLIVTRELLVVDVA